MKKSVFIPVALLIALTFVSCSKKEDSVQTDKKIPSSIVCLSPSAAEICFAVGAGNKVKAVSQFTDYPPEAAALPVTGGFDGSSLSIETILSFNPDLVYLTAGMHDFLIEPLKQNNVACYVSNATSVTAVINEILEVGELTGNKDQALEVVKEMENTISLCNFSSKEKPKTVYYEVWDNPHISAGASSFINDVICKSGGRNLCGSIPEAYPIISEEAIIAGNPDVILLSASSTVSVDDVKNRGGWQNIEAIKNDNIIIIDDNVFTRPGPRIARIIYDLSLILNNL